MTASKREINEYLFYEFGRHDTGSDVARLADDWPFELSSLGTVEAVGRSWVVYKFSDGAEDYFAVANGALSFLSVAGMELHHLAMQLEGEAWIAGKNPVPLGAVEGPESETPSVPVRRAAIKALIGTLNSAADFEILEGLYLKSSRRYLAFVRAADSGACHVIGDRIRIRNVPFPDATPWRRLAVAIGKCVRSGDLKRT